MIRPARATLIALALLALPASPHSRAAVGAVDQVPGATLLLPYFETDLEDPSGRTTMFRIYNAASEPKIAHVTVWTELGIPTLAFDVYLSGFDVATIDMRLVFDGILPQTSSSLVNRGVFSAAPVAFPDCDALQPIGRLSPQLVANLAAAHTGEPMPLDPGRCASVARGDSIARGFVTVDNAMRCSVAFPSSPGYFTGPDQVASDVNVIQDGRPDSVNVLWGEYALIDRAGNASVGGAMTTIQASPSDPLTATPDPPTAMPTFYGRFVGWNAADHREPLPDRWQARFAAGADGLAGVTELLVWRDPGVAVESFACGGALPSPFPMSQQQILAFDDDGNVVAIDAPSAFPWAANAVQVGPDASSLLPAVFPSGSFVLDLSTATGSAVDPARQAFVTTLHVVEGRWATSTTGIPLIDAGTVPQPAGQTPAPGQDATPTGGAEGTP